MLVLHQVRKRKSVCRVLLVLEQVCLTSPAIVAGGEPVTQDTPGIVPNILTLCDFPVTSRRLKETFVASPMGFQPWLAPSYGYAALSLLLETRKNGLERARGGIPVSRWSWNKVLSIPRVHKETQPATTLVRTRRLLNHSTSQGIQRNWISSTTTINPAKADFIANLRAFRRRATSSLFSI